MIFDLNRFKVAQDLCYREVLGEMKNGKKVGHWMWYIFPQIKGLGKSLNSKKYEIENIQEVKLYLKDELLSQRLIKITNILVYDIQNISLNEIFSYTDCFKFHSSMTLFYTVVKSDNLLNQNIKFCCFEDALNKYFDGKLDEYTTEILNKPNL